MPIIIFPICPEYDNILVNILNCYFNDVFQINERTFGSRKREANNNHNLKYPPTKVAQYSTLNHN